MTNTLILLSVPLLPMLTALYLLSRRRGRGSYLTPLAALPALAAALTLDAGVTVAYPWLVLGTHMGLDEVGRTFLLIAALLWLAGAVYAQSYLRNDPHRLRFHVFYLLSMAGNFGLILAQDLVSFYIFFSLMSFSAYGLIVHYGLDEARRAGRVYLYLTVTGELLLFAAFVWLAHEGENLSFDGLAGVSGQRGIQWLLLAGFAIKAGIFPLHFWLPLAHPVAPVPASAVLSGAMIKAGLLGWLRLLPPGGEGLAEAGQLLLAGGVFTAGYGVAAGIFQAHPKTILAYSSCSQMGVMTALLGLGLVHPELHDEVVAVLLIYAAHHALVKGGLFLGVGLCEARNRGWVMAGLALLALSLAGAPLSSGAIAKQAAASVLVGHDLLSALLAGATAGTALLMAVFLWRMAGHRMAERPIGVTMWLGWGILLGAVLAFPALAGYREPMSPLAGLLPIYAGAALFALFYLGARRGWFVAVSVPPGDIAGMCERLMYRLREVAERTAYHLSMLKKAWSTAIGDALARWYVRLQNPGAESLLTRWESAGVLYLLIIAALAVALSL